MSVVAAAILTTAAVGAYSSRKARKSGEAAINSQLELSKAEYETYKTKILPLELEAKQLGITGQQLAVQRGQTDLDLYNDYYVPLQKEMIGEATNVEAQYDRVTRDAAMDVDSAFGRQKEIEQRDAERTGLRPDSGRYKGMDRSRELEQAGTRSFAINRAKEGERDRVETTKFNRMATVLGRQPGASAPTQGAPNPNAPSGLSQAYGNQATMYGNQANRDMQSAGDALWTGANLYSRFKGGSTTAPSQSPSPFSGQVTSQPSVFNQPQSSGIAGVEGYADGGLVEGRRGVDNVPATINNNEPAALSDGEFVIPKDVVMKKGTDFFEKMLEQYHEGPPPKKTAGLNENRGMH